MQSLCFSRAALVVAALAPFTACSAATNEQQVLQELNALRRHPARYAEMLEARVKLFRGNILRLPGKQAIRTREGAAAVREAVRVLRGSRPMPPLAWSDALARAARDHVRDIGPKGLVAHDGTDGSSPSSRAERYMKDAAAVAETIAFGPDDPRSVVLELIVDDGVPSRGHRKILLDRRYRRAGVACGAHAIYRHMCVINLAATSSELE